MMSAQSFLRRKELSSRCASVRLVTLRKVYTPCILETRREDLAMHVAVSILSPVNIQICSADDKGQSMEYRRNFSTHVVKEKNCRHFHYDIQQCSLSPCTKKNMIIVRKENTPQMLAIVLVLYFRHDQQEMLRISPTPPDETALAAIMSGTLSTTEMYPP